jgi:hypothetical protein
LVFFLFSRGADILEILKEEGETEKKRIQKGKSAARK